ncbi:MAG: hypothetical protein P8Z78_09700 [Gammaproteobacteria bacterium]|jgi:hypothetical protein
MSAPRLLLIGYSGQKKYSGVFMRNVQRALSSLGLEFDVMPPEACESADLDGYVLFLGVGDELFRRRPELVDLLHEAGGKVVDFRTKYLPSKVKSRLAYYLQGSSKRADYVLTHMQDRCSRCFYVGQGVNDDLLYPEHDDTFTLFVDHWMPRRRECVQQILDQCRELFESRENVRVWYQSAHGIVENDFTATPGDYKTYPFEELAAFYRKTHLFLPTHRETQGVVAAEIGMCGGLTLLQPWMYPKERRLELPHHLYRKKIIWPEAVDIEANRTMARKHFGLDAFAVRLQSAFNRIGALG